MTRLRARVRRHGHGTLPSGRHDTVAILHISGPVTTRALSRFGGPARSKDHARPIMEGLSADVLNAIMETQDASEKIRCELDKGVRS